MSLGMYLCAYVLPAMGRVYVVVYTFGVGLSTLLVLTGRAMREPQCVERVIGAGSTSFFYVYSTELLLLIKT